MKSPIKQKHKDYLLHTLSAQNIQKQCLVEVFGDRRVVLENHKGVIEYSAQRICVKAHLGCIRICGQNLSLAQMTSDQLIILGEIHSVSFVKRGT